MAADTQLPITGKDVRMELLVAGVPVSIQDQVTTFTKRRVTTKIETKVIGSSTKYIDQEPDGWEGEIEIAENRGGAETFIDAVDAAQRVRLPNSIQITETKFYRDGSSRSFQYPDVKVDFESTSRRGQTVQTRLSWMSGVARIPL